MRAESSLQTCGSAEGLVFITEEGPFPSPSPQLGTVQVTILTRIVV